MKQDLRDLTHAETRAFAGTLGVEPYRGDQIFRWVHGRRVARVEAMTDLAKELRARVADAAEVRTLAVDAEQVSKDGTRKLRLRTDDGRMIETVLIPDGDAAAPDDDLEEESGASAGAPAARALSQAAQAHAVRVVAGRLRARLQLLRDRAARLRAPADGRRDCRPGLSRAGHRRRARARTIRRGAPAPIASPTSSSWAWASRCTTTRT